MEQKEIKDLLKLLAEVLKNDMADKITITIKPKKK